MKSRLLILVLIALILTLASCNKDTKNNDYVKPVTGIDPIFTEDLGYYNEQPSVIQVSSKKRYVYYTRNLEAFNKRSDSIAVRVGTKEKGKWTYGQYKTVLSLNESNWDSKFINGCDVISGFFNYNGETYNYLMAYSATDNVAGRYEGKIGFAVAKDPTDEFIRVGDVPFVNYNSDEYLTYSLVKGCFEPSLVSYDKSGKFYLFYSLLEPHGKSSMCIEVDGTNLNDIKHGNRILVSKENITDTGLHSAILSADWAWDDIYNEFVVVRDYWLLRSEAPLVAEGIQVVRGTKDVLYDVPNGEEYKGAWITVKRKISFLDTALEDSEDESKQYGYSCIFSGSIVTDEYGHIIDSDSIEILFTSQTTPETELIREDAYLYSQAIHSIEIEVNR